MVEPVHRQLKDSLRACLAGNRWLEHLPWVLLGLRAAPKDESGVSSAELVYGVPLTLPGQLLSSSEPPSSRFSRPITSRQFAADSGDDVCRGGGNYAGFSPGSKMCIYQEGGSMPSSRALVSGSLCCSTERAQMFQSADRQHGGGRLSRPLKAALRDSSPGAGGPSGQGASKAGTGAACRHHLFCG
jgi:hypothetical protein